MKPPELLTLLSYGPLSKTEILNMIGGTPKRNHSLGARLEKMVRDGKLKVTLSKYEIA